MKARILALVLVLTLVFGLTTSAAAQSNYSFQLSTEVVHVFLNQDGTMALDYSLTFKNDSGAKAIDFVDLGLPNGNYDFGSITADVGGSRVNVTTDYQGSGTGVAIDLGNKAIRQTGTVHVYVGRIEKMFFPDTENDKYASSEFAPTYFSSDFVHGSTDLTVAIHLPPGIKSTEPKYHPARGGWPGAADPIVSTDQDGRMMYIWQSPDANGSTQYTFGASFPATYIPADAVVRISALEMMFSAIADFIGGLMEFLPFCCFGLFFFGMPIWGVISERKRKLQYIKPSISIEGHGIKRGLTAVEAAILMSQPLDKVMTMILFSTVKKGAIQVVTRDPLKVEMLQPQPENLQAYETEFVAAMVKDDRQRRKDLQAMTVNLVKSVTEKLKGFSRKETLEYYKTINEKAWQQIEAAGTPEVKSQMFEEALEWTMLDKDYDDRSRRVFTGPVFVPMWWGRYDPVYRGSSTPQASSMGLPSMPSSPGGGRASLPGADFAASVVGGVQNFSGRVLGNINDFTSGVTNVTNPPPPPSRSGGGRSGGGCACACAGCACACAGGGR
jgi:hypothetical protein